MWNGLERPNASARSPLPVASLTLQCTACYRMKAVKRRCEATMSLTEECCRARLLLQSWVPGRYGMLVRERRRWTRPRRMVYGCRILSALVLMYWQVNVQYAERCYSLLYLSHTSSALPDPLSCQARHRAGSGPRETTWCLGSFFLASTI